VTEPPAGVAEHHDVAAVRLVSLFTSTLSPVQPEQPWRVGSMDPDGMTNA
jgi:hypothetical protein